MIKGYLKILVLSELQDKPMSGFTLMKKMKAKFNKGPSPGSLYPLLLSLEAGKLIRGKDEGRSKIYTITANGRRHITKLLEEKEERIRRHIGICSSIEGIAGDKVKMMDHVKEKILRNLDILSELKENLIRHVSGSAFDENEKEIRSILNDANRKLKGLKWDS